MRPRGGARPRSAGEGSWPAILPSGDREGVLPYPCFVVESLDYPKGCIGVEETERVQTPTNLKNSAKPRPRGEAAKGEARDGRAQKSGGAGGDLCRRHGCPGTEAPKGGGAIVVYAPTPARRTRRGQRRYDGAIVFIAPYYDRATVSGARRKGAIVVYAPGFFDNSTAYGARPRRGRARLCSCYDDNNRDYGAPTWRGGARLCWRCHQLLRRLQGTSIFVYGGLVFGVRGRKVITCCDFGGILSVETS